MQKHQTLSNDRIASGSQVDFAESDYTRAFQAGFVTNRETIGPPEKIGKAVLAHSPLGVALVILGIEWMTQQHYLESVRDDEDLDPQFKSLLRYHWMEEAQHTKLDTLMVQASATEIEQGLATTRP